MPDLARVAARGASVTVAAQLTRLGLLLVGLTVLSRLLSPAQVGLVAMATSVIGVADIVRDFGLSSAALQAKSLTESERANLWWVNLSIGTACAAVAACLAPVIAHAYGDRRVESVVLVLSTQFILSGANTQYRVDLARQMRFTALAATDIAAQLVSVIVAITAAVLGAGYWSIVAQQLTFTGVSMVVNVAMCRWLPGRPRRGVPMRRFFTFGGSVLGTQVMGYAMNNVDNVAIGAVWGAAPLGLYNRAYQLLAVPLTQLNAPLSRVVLPVLSQVQDDRETLQRYTQRFQLVSCYTLGLGFGLAAGLASPLVLLLFGRQWTAVAPIFVVLAAGSIFKSFDQVPYQVYLAKGLTRQLLKFYLVSRPIMLAMILAGLPWGPVGVATGHLVAASVHWAVALLLVSRLAGIDSRPLFRQSARALLVVITPAALLEQLACQLLVNPWAQVGLGLILATAWMALAYLAVKPLRHDVRLLVAQLAKIIRRTPAEPHGPAEPTLAG
jgi:O-antigen/teichoic acid export membrane protein